MNINSGHPPYIQARWGGRLQEGKEESVVVPEHKNAKYVREMQADQIAKRIARGKYVTQTERDQVRHTDPAKLDKAEQANEQRTNLNRRLQKTTSKDEAKQVIVSAAAMSKHIFDAHNQDLGQYTMEAVQEAEKEHFTYKKRVENTTPLVEKLKTQLPQFDKRL